jgi:hypothetical protein
VRLGEPISEPGRKRIRAQRCKGDGVRRAGTTGRRPTGPEDPVEVDRVRRVGRWVPQVVASAGASADLHGDIIGSLTSSGAAIGDAFRTDPYGLAYGT